MLRRNNFHRDVAVQRNCIQYRQLRCEDASSEMIAICCECFPNSLRWRLPGSSKYWRALAVSKSCVCIVAYCQESRRIIGFSVVVHNEMEFSAIPRGIACYVLSSLKRVPRIFTFYQEPFSRSTLSLSEDSGPRVWIDLIAVLPSYAGRGIGSMLLNHSVARAFESGAAKVEAMVSPTNRASIKLFESAGFKKSKSCYRGDIYSASVGY